MPREPQNGSEKKIKRARGATPPATERKDGTRTPLTRKTASLKLAAPEAEMREADARQAGARQAGAREVKPGKKVEARKIKEKRAAASASARSASSKQTGIAVIGAGRLGSALARALDRSGYTVVALVARRASHARLAARAFSPRPLALDATQLNLLPDTTDLILVTTPDDQIAQVAVRLDEVFAARPVAVSARVRRRVALHASGALLSDALAPLGAHGFSLGSLHPLVSIAETESGAENLRGAFYCLEGEERALRSARKIVRALGGRSFSVAARDKPLYHAAAVMTAGHAVALFSLATEMLVRCGLSSHQASRVLLPLAESALSNLARSEHVAQALTGPFARADVATLRRHLDALREFDPDVTLAVYVALGRHALRLARRRGAAGAGLDEIEALLEGAR